MEIDCDQASDVISKHIKDIYFKASITTVETPRKDVPPKGIKGRIGGKGEIKKIVNKLRIEKFGLTTCIFQAQNFVPKSGERA